MNILQLCLSPDLGGLELYMARAAIELSKKHHVTAVVGHEAKLIRYLDGAKIPLFRLKRTFKPLPLLAARRLAKIIDEQAIDRIHMHWGKDLPLAVLAKRLSKRKPKLVYTRQMQITRPKRDRYHEFMFSNVDLVITITKALGDAMRRFLNPRYAERVVPLYYGVAEPRSFLSADERRSLRQQLGLPDDAFLVGLFGRIKRYKGQHLLVEALARAASEGKPIAGLIVGRAMELEYLEGLKEQCKGQGIADRVIFKDFIDNPQQLMQACDCVILTTVEETFGLVLVEAMRAGVPVIGSDRGGVPEIIDHGETGLMFRSGDSGSLYQQILALSEDAALCKRLASAGKEKADRLFNEEQHWPALDALFDGPLLKQESVG